MTDEPTLAMIVGARLRELRQEAEMTQAEVAELMHTSRPSIAGIEKGKYAEVLIDTLLKYTSAIGVTKDVVFVAIDPEWRRRMDWSIEDTDNWRMRRDSGVLKVTRKTR